MAIKPFVAVHAGAGYHSVAKEADYINACKAACRAGITALTSNVSALEAVVSVMVCLEDATCTNAGTGSNLTLYGTVECDASVMDGQTTAYGAVGAVSGIKNPVCVAKKLIDTQAEGLSLGRIPPSMLVGQGAHDWAVKQGIGHVSEQTMVTESSQRTYENYKRKLLNHGDKINHSAKKKYRSKKTSLNHNHHSDSTSRSRGEIDLFINSNDDNINSSSITKDDISEHQDTVGAMCIDTQGNIACAVSSGGLSLKQPGRLGSAATYGAGCWASNQTVLSAGVGVVTSGTGEHLIRTNFAKEFADCVLSDDDTTLAVNKAFDLKFFASPLLGNVKHKYAGALLVKLEEANEIELVWAHCTASMCVGYVVGGTDPKAYISRLTDSQEPGKSLNVQGKHFYL